MLGFCNVVIIWMRGSNMNITTEVNEMRRAVRFRVKGQPEVQARVSEAYSPARVTGMAEQMGLAFGLAMDLTTCNQLGNPWGFNNAVMMGESQGHGEKARRPCCS